MLKRQRPTSPIPSLPSLPGGQELPFESYERVAKRRRQFAHRGRTPGNPYDDGEDYQDEGEDDTEADGGRSEYREVRSRWQEQAGMYKQANTLLHDLHAEQRHRILFSPSSSSHPWCSTTQGDISPHGDSGKLMDATRHHPYPYQPTPPLPPHTVSSKTVAPESLCQPRGDVSIEDVEVQRVTERYENTNK